MNIKNKIKAIELKTLIVPIILTILILIISEKFIIDDVKRYYFNHIKQESINFTKNYSRSLTNATEAHEIINNLLEEKILVASKTISLYEGEINNTILEDMARNLEIDVAYYYNSQGEVTYSSHETYIGWKPDDGHPVYEFMVSDNISLVEDIRKDSESDLYYKYGYFKAPNGGFVQIGVSAEKVQNFLNNFEIQELLDNLKLIDQAVQICFLDNNLIIMGSTNKELIGSKLVNQEAKEAISRNKEYSSIGSLNDKRVYEVYSPVFSKGHRIGFVHVVHPLEETEMVIKNVNIASTIGLSIIFILVLYVILSTYYKNKQLVKLAYYDTLTDLPNREYLIEYLTEALKKNKKGKKAIFLINCSNFRTINLVSGYNFGDMVLEEVSNRLKKQLYPYNKIFRFTSDRFVVFIDNYYESSDLISLSKMISKAFSNPIVENKYVNIQIGIVEIDSKYDRADQILKDVSIALSYINNNDINYIFFNREMDKKLEREELIEKAIRNVLSETDTKELYLEYQPQLDLKTNKILGFEALARMKSEELGFVSPVEFIDVAEKKHLIVPLGNLILKTACEFIRRLVDQGHEDIKVAVNISGIQLLREDFRNNVINIITETGIEGRNLELEITESILVENFELINLELKLLKEFGIKIALDDFGTGYSSFARLKELNIDIVKIDRYFINRINNRVHNNLITGDIISMSHKIGLAVVAEGVELEDQKEYLIANNCNIIQGYLFSKPIAEEAAVKMLKDNNSN